MLVCELLILELVRLAPNEPRARELAARLGAFDALAMPQSLWIRAREVQLPMAATGDHRRVPPADLLIAATAELAKVPIVHYDRDYEPGLKRSSQHCCCSVVHLHSLSGECECLIPRLGDDPEGVVPARTA